MQWHHRLSRLRDEAVLVPMTERACPGKGTWAPWKAVKWKLYFFILAVGCLHLWTCLYPVQAHIQCSFCLLWLVISTHSFILKELIFSPMIVCLLSLSTLHNICSLSPLTLTHAHTRSHTYPFIHTLPHIHTIHTDTYSHTPMCTYIYRHTHTLIFI